MWSEFSNILKTGKYQWLEKRLFSEAKKLLEGQEQIESFTSHGVKHSLMILKIANMLSKQRVNLTHIERLVLKGAILLHDIALSDSSTVLGKQITSRGYYISELREKHGEYAANYIRNNIYRQLVEEDAEIALKIRENSDILEAIARICQFHTSIAEYKSLLDAPSNRLERLGVVGYIFLLADDLEYSPARLDIPKVLKTDLSLEQKEFWMLRSSIQNIQVLHDSIVLEAIRPKRIGDKRFLKLVRPLVDHIENKLEEAKKCFDNHNIKALNTTIKIQVAASREKEEGILGIHQRDKMDTESTKGRRRLIKAIDEKTHNPGVLEKKSIGDEFIVFRKWGSSTHRLFANSSGLQRGGGYYLSWNNIGICIDPGYDFLASLFSMQNLSFTIKDLHGAIISHAHDDHTQDIETIISLQYRMRKESNHDERILDDFPLICSEGVRWKYAPISASNDFLSIIDLIPTKNSIRREVSIPSRNYASSLLQDAGITIKAMLSYHGESPWHMNNTGLVTRIELNDGNVHRSIGYTGDTGYHDDIRNFLNGCDIVLMHLGNKLDDNTGGVYPKHHLGEGGVVDLISTLKLNGTKLFLVGEYGADEFIVGGRDSRIDYTESLARWSGANEVESPVLPSDIGLRVRLTDCKVWCEHDTVQGQPTADNINGSWQEPIDVRPLLVGGNEIHYLVRSV
jgi:hypothetical protein